MSGLPPTSPPKGVAFRPEMTDSERYQELCNQLRPSLLKIPHSSPPGAKKIIIKQFPVAAAPTSSRSANDSDGTPLDGIAMTEKHPLAIHKEERTPSSDSQEDAVRLLLCVTSLHLPASNVIPEDRIRTPRTPRTPSDCHRKRRTHSPVDECRGSPVATTPKEVLIHRYKSMTPKYADFVM